MLERATSGADLDLALVSASKMVVDAYASCMGGVEVTLCSLPGTGHILYDSGVGFSVPDVAWDMFKRQPMS
jgi:hypothetical protein